MLVLLFHVGLPAIGGGFIGVDVFFVLSGFLITGLLVRELQRTGTVSLSGFYARRARRLLPAAAVCIVVTVSIAAFVLPPLRVPDVTADGVAAALYVSNFRFALDATDYLRSDVAPSPLLHYWSLGVEEQFYLIWPALLLLVAGRGGNVVRRVAIAAALIGALSLGLSLWLTVANAPWAFYSLPTRAWELGIGALLAVSAGAASRRLRPTHGRVLLWTGLGMIAASAVVIGTSTPFPGVAALLPALGTALVILAGSSTSGRRSPLEIAPLRFLGKISYSLYLWHWPLLVLPAAAIGAALPLQVNLALMAVAIVIATASQRWIEDPIRQGTLVGLVPQRNLAAAGAMTLALVITATAIGRTSEHQLATAAASGGEAVADIDDLLEPVSAQYGGSVLPTPDHPDPSPTSTPITVDLRLFSGPVPANLAPALVEAKADRPLIYVDGCHVEETQSAPRECIFGDEDASPTVVLMGDSHAAQWFPALDALGKEQHWRLVSMTKSGCPPAEATIWVATFGRAYTECDEWRAAVFDRIAELHPDLVVVSMTFGQQPIVDGKRLDGTDARDFMVYALGRTLDRLDTMARGVALIADTPRASDDPPVCLSSNLDDTLACATARSTAIDGRWLAEQAEVARESGSAFIDPTPWVCPTDPCPAVIGRYLVYRDTHHLTTTYAMAMRERLGAVLPVPRGIRRGLLE